MFGFSLYEFVIITAVMTLSLGLVSLSGVDRVLPKPVHNKDHKESECPDEIEITR